MKHPRQRAVYLPMVITSNDDGYLAKCPGIQGAFGEGETIDEALFNCIDVVKMIAAYRKERHESIGIGEIEMTPNTQLSMTIPVGV